MSVRAYRSCRNLLRNLVRVFGLFSLGAVLSNCGGGGAADASKSQATSVNVSSGLVTSTSSSSEASSSSASQTSSADNIPAPAASAGYTQMTFSTVANFNSAHVNLSNMPTSGYQWYLWNFFGENTAASSIQLNADGSVTVSGGNSNGQLASAATTGTSPNFVGQAFGGGAYFEAEISFNQNNVNYSNGWPSVWAMSLEHLINMSTVQWPEQATGYNHFIETDIFEYLDQVPNTYKSTLHDWYGIYRVTCASFCAVDSTSNVKSTAQGFDWSQYHKVGMLWIPATATQSGSVTFYLDGSQQGPAVTYTQFTSQAPVPTQSTPWTYGIIDQQHIVLVLGSGTDAPMTVRAFNVWQANAAGNLVN